MIYVVMNEGEPVYASVNKDEAEAYTYTQNINGTNETLEEWGNDDPTDEDMAEAAFQNGFDGGYREVVCIDIDKADEDGTITLSDGTEIVVADVLDFLAD